MDFFYPKFNITTHTVLSDSINSDQYPYNASYVNKKTFKLKEGAEVCAVRENIGYKCEWSEVLVIDTQLTDAEYYNKRVFVKTAFLKRASNKKTFTPVCSEENSINVLAQEIDPNLKEIFIPYIDQRNGLYSVRIQTDYEKILDSFLFENLVNDVLFEGTSILLQSRGLRSDNATIQNILDTYCTFAYVQNDFDLTINRKCEPITFTVSIPLSFFNQLPETQDVDDTFDLVVNTIKFDNKTAFRTINDIIKMFSYRAADIIGITFPNYLIENFTIDIEQANLRLFANSLNELLQATSPSYAINQNKYIEYSFGLDKNYNLVRIEIRPESEEVVVLKKDQVSRFRMTGAFHNKRIFNYLLKSENFLAALKDIKNKILPILQEYVDFPKISLVKESLVLNGQTLPPEKVREFRVAFSNKKEGCLNLSSARGAFIEGLDIYSDPLYHSFINGGHEQSGKDQKLQPKPLMESLREFKDQTNITGESFSVNTSATLGSAVGGFADSFKQQFPTNINTISYILNRLNINKIFISKLICLITGLNPSDPRVAEILGELPDQLIQHINYLNTIKGLEGAQYAKAVANGLNINSGLFCIQNQDVIYLVKGLTALLKVANYTGATLVKFQKIKNTIANLKGPGQKINPYAQLGRAVGTALAQAAIASIFDTIKNLLDASCEDPALDSGNRYENLFSTTAPTIGYANTTSNSDKNTLNRNRGNVLDETFGTQAQLQYGFDRTYTIDLLDLLFNDINCILTPAESISLLKGTPTELVKTLVKNIIRNKYYAPPNDLSFMLSDENKLFGFFKRLGLTVDEAGIADKLEPIANPINPSNICSNEQLEARSELIKGKLPKNFDVLDRQLRTRTLKAKTLLEKIKDGSQDIDLNPLCDIDDAAKNNFVDHMTSNYYNLLEDTFKSPLATFNDEANLLPTVYENKKSLIRKQSNGKPIGAVQYKNYNEGLYYNLASNKTLQTTENISYKELYLPLEHERTAGELSLAILPTNESENKIDILCNPDLVPLDKEFEQLFLAEGSDQGEALIWMEVFSVGEPADYTFDNTTNDTSGTKSDLNEMYDTDNSSAYKSKLAKSLRKKPYFIAIEINRESVGKHKYDLKFILNDTYNEQFRVLAHLVGESEQFGNDGGWFLDNKEEYDSSDYPEIYGITKDSFNKHIRNVGKAVIYSFYKKDIKKALESSNTLNTLLENLNKFNKVGLYNIETTYDNKLHKLTKHINAGVMKNNGQVDQIELFSINEVITDVAPYENFSTLSSEVNETSLSDKTVALHILRGSILNSINRGEVDVSYVKNGWSNKETTYIQNQEGSNPGQVVDSPRYDDGPSIESPELDAYPKPDQNNPYYQLFSKLSLFNRPKNTDYAKCNTREHYLNFDFFRDRYLKAFEVQLCESVVDTADVIKKLAAELLIRELVSETLLKALPYFGSMTKEQFISMYKDKTYRNIVNSFVIKEAEKKFSPVSYFTDILVDIYQNDNDIIKKSSELIELTSDDPIDYYIAREIRYFSQYCIKYSIIKFAEDTISNFVRQDEYDLDIIIGKDEYSLRVKNDTSLDIISYSTKFIKEQDVMVSGQDQVTSVRGSEYSISNQSLIYQYLDNEYKYELIYFILHGKLKHELDSAFIGTKNILASLILQHIQATEGEDAAAEQTPDYQDINNFITNLAFSPNPSAMVALRPEYSRYIKYFLTAALNLARSQTLTIAKTMDPNIMLTRAIDESLATIGMLSWSLISQETRNNMIKGDSGEGTPQDTQSIFYKRLEDGRSLSPDLLTATAIVWIPLTPVGWGYLGFDTVQEIQYTQKALTEIRALRGLKDGQDPCEITTSPITSVDANPPSCDPDKRERALTDINSIEPEYDKS